MPTIAIKTEKENIANTVKSKKVDKKEQELIKLIRKVQRDLAPYFKKGIIKHPA